MQTKDNLPPCVLDSRCRNLIPDETLSYECKWEDCSRTFLKINDFMDHIRDHGTHEAKFRRQNEKNAMICRWADCRKTFTVKAIFADHRRTHTKEKQCGCPNCGTLFRNFSKFYDHFRRQSAASEWAHHFRSIRTFVSESLFFSPFSRRVSMQPVLEIFLFHGITAKPSARACESIQVHNVRYDHIITIGTGSTRSIQTRQGETICMFDV